MPIRYLSGLTVDSTVLVVDAANDRVGIGTAGPLGTLDIGKSSATPSLVIGNSSYPSTYNSVWGLQGGAESIMIFGNNGQNEIRAGSTGVGGYLDFYTNNTALFTAASNGNFAMRLAANGNVGIGTTAPEQKLHVEGTIQLGNQENLAWAYDNGSYYNYITNFYDTSTGMAFRAGSWTGGNNVDFSFQTYYGGSWSTKLAIKGDGNVGIGTTAPVGILHLYKAAAATRLAIDGDAGQNRLISYRTGALQRFGLYVNNTAESGSNAGSNFAIRAYSDAGTLLSTPFFINRATGNVGIGTTAPSAKLEVQGADSSIFQAIFQSRVSTDNGYNGGIQLGNAAANQNSQIYHSSSGDNTLTFVSNYSAGTGNKFIFAPGGTERVRFQQNGNVGIGTTSVSNFFTVVTNLGGSPANLSELEPYSTVKIKARSDRDNILYIAAKDALTGMLLQSGTTSTAADLLLNPFGGNVGIGVASPNEKLHVGGNINAYINGGIDAGLFASTSAGSTTIALRSNGITHFNGGNVGIGTTSPSYKTSVVAANANYWNGTAFTGTPLAISIENSQAGGYDPVLIYNQADSAGTLKNSGAIGMVGTAAWTAGDDAAQVSDMYFLVRNSSGALQERARLKSNGHLILKSTTSGGGTQGDFYIIENGGLVIDASEGATQRYIEFTTGGTSKALITAGGNFLIGTTTDAGFKLDVNGTARTLDLSIKNSANAETLDLFLSPSVFSAFIDYPTSRDLIFRNKTTGTALTLASTGAATFSSSVTASSLIKSGGTSAQYLMADGSTSTITGANVYTQTFFTPGTGGTSQWTKLGTWTAAQGGNVVTVQIDQHAGYNATTNQNKQVYIYMKTSNGSSVDANGFAADSTFWTEGLNTSIPAGDVIWESNAAGVAATTYTLYVFMSQYTNGSQYTVTTRGGTWANVGTLTAPSGTTGSSTILLSENRFVVNNVLTVGAPSGNVLIGTTADAGFKLDVSGTGRFSGANLTIGSAVAATNVKLLLNGVASKAAGIEFQQNGTSQWYIGNGIASEDNNFELYNSNGTMAMKIIKSTNAINFIGTFGVTGAATFSSSVEATSFVKTSGTSAQYLMADGSVSTLTNPVTGTGTTNYVPKFTGASTIGDSLLVDNGTNVYLGNVDGGGKALVINGTGATTATIYFDSTTKTYGLYQTGTQSNLLTGNLGLGVTPSAWNSIYKVAEIGTAAIFGTSSYNSAAFSTNVFYNASNSPRYIANDFANMYWQDDGNHIWYNAPSGTAGDAITFTQAMTLTAGGNLGIGTTAPGVYRLAVSSSDYRVMSLNSTYGQMNMDFANSGVYFASIGSGNSQSSDAGILASDFGIGTMGSATNKIIFATGTGYSTRMAILPSGNVGIGTTSPAQALQVVGNAWINRPSNKVDNASCTEFGSRVEFNNAFVAGSTGYVVFNYPAASVFRIYADYDGNLGGLQPDIQLGLAYLTVKSSGGNIGNVGIGTTSPGVKLDIDGGSNGASVRVKGDQPAGAYYYGYMYDGTNLKGTTQTNIFYSGSTIAANTTIAEYAGLRIDAPSVAATGAVVTNNYGIYQSGSVQKNYFAGNVGIGTTSPGAKLEVKPSGDGDIFIGRYSGGSAKLIYAYQSSADGFLELRTGGDNIVTKLSGYSGTPSYFLSNVGIGTTSPTYKLSVEESTTNPIAYFGLLPTNVSSRNSLIILQSGTIPQSGSDTTGEVGFLFKHSYGTGGVNGTANGGYIESIRESVFGITSQVNTALIFGTSAANTDNERMRINSAGNVGIGNSSPQTNGASAVLDVGNGSGGTLNLRDTNTGIAAEGFNQIFGGDNRMYLYAGGSGASSYMQFYTNDVERMRIHTNGNFGVGTTNPIQPLTVSAIANASTIALLGRAADNASRIDFYNNAGNSRLYTVALGNSAVEHYADANIPMVFSTNAAERMRITAGGNVLIGTSTDSGYKLDVVGDTRITSGSLGVGVAPNATDGRIDASNDIVAFQTSDRRLKENIKPIENALEKVKSLTGVEFDWKPELKHAHGYEGHDTGVIAQEVQEVMPTAIRTNDTGYLAVRYEKLIGLLIEGMKEQQLQIDELKSKLK